MKPSVGLIGLGLMGHPIAVNVLNKGFSLTVWNRTASRAQDLVSQGARLAATPHEAAAASDVLLMIVSDPPAVELHRPGHRAPAETDAIDPVMDHAELVL